MAVFVPWCSWLLAGTDSSKLAVHPLVCMSLWLPINHTGVIWPNIAGEAQKRIGRSWKKRVLLSDITVQAL